MRIAVIANVVLCVGSAHAERRINPLSNDRCIRCGVPVEAPDSLGVVSGVTWHGDVALGIAGRLALSERFAFDGQARWRDDRFIGGLGVAWTLTFGKIETTYDDRTSPLRFDVVAGGGVVDTEPAVIVAVVLRVRASAHVSIDVGVRDEIVKPRGLGLRDDPELQVAISLTSPNVHRIWP